jgi:hypothetical protein
MSGHGMLKRLMGGTVLVAALCAGASLQAWGQETSARSPAKSGKVTGIVTARTDKDITVKAEGTQKVQRYRLAAQPGGAPTADVQAAMKMVFVTNVVVLQWQGEPDPVVTSIRAMHSKTRFGSVAGTVTAVEPAANMPSFDVKPNGKGFTERYVPRWDVAAKGWDKNLVRTIAGLSVGDKVKVAWSYDERKRATQIQVTAKAKPKSAENSAGADESP